MDFPQRERVNQLFETCRVLPPHEREAQLAYAGDPEVAAEVRSLLDAYDRSADFLEQPALAQHAAIVDEAIRPRARLEPGSRIGHFEIAETVGSGGMGVVYRARDTLLGRDVALKLLPPAVANDPHRRARFQGEARAVAALNHPNVAAIYAVEEDALVMEWVPGPTLEECIQAGPLPLDRAVAVARQIADALDAAHERGIVHRDLKPANIKLTPEGVVKVLDFGLAKARENDSAERRAGMTDPGTILGTAGYMAPEQAAAKPVDKRADIWAFGVVLFEMITGQPLFDGESNSHRIAAILTKEPDLNLVSPRVRRLLQSCLEKDPRRRLRDIADWSRLLEEAPARVSKIGFSRSALPWLVAALAVAAALVPRAIRRDSNPPASQIRTDLVIPATDDPSAFALSPDGKRIAFAASEGGRKRLWVRELDSRTAQPLPGTEGATSPFWSPDGRALGFFADLKLKRVDLGGVQPRELAAAFSITAQGAWGAGGTILFTAGVMPLSRVSASGGPVTEATTLAKGQSNPLAPRFLPNGRQFLYLVTGADPSIWLGSLDGAAPRRIASIVVATDSAAEYVEPGWLVRVRQGVLEAQRFDAASAQLSGDPVPLERSVAADVATMAGMFSASSSGAIVYRGQGGEQRQMVWFNRTGRKVGVFGGIGDTNLYCPELAPGGKQVAVMRGPPGSADIWLQDELRNSRLTLDQADDRYAIWSPDGMRIAFSSNRNGSYDLYEKAANGWGGDQILLHSPDFKRPNSWSPDGNYILYASELNNGDLFVLPLAGDRKPLPLVSTPFNEQQGVFSPDGKWVAYQSDETGRFEIYVRPFPAAGGHTQVSVEGGHSPRWRADSRELFYLSPDLKMMAAKLAVNGPALTVETLEPLFQTNINRATNRQQYDVASDGRFLILTDLTNTSSEPLHLLLNWKPMR